MTGFLFMTVQHVLNTCIVIAEIATLVDVDITKYRKLHDTKVVKKTLTIPNYLNQLGKENHVNFSEILTSALKVQLKV